jgi:hypothetical protein
MHVLITGARAPACLEWARAFHEEGWRVSVADSLSLPLSRGSRAVDSFFRLPEASAGASAWGEALRAVVERAAVDVVLPTCEEAFYLAHEKAKLPAGCRAIVADFSVMASLHHKGEFAARTSGWPVGTPETHAISERSQLARFEPEPENWVFKPAFSRFAARTLIRPGRAALARLVPTASDPWVAQRFIAGREYCTYSVLGDGRVHAHVCYHPKYRVGKGSGIFFEPADPPAVRGFVEHFARETNYAGQVGFDFIEQADGKTFVLECNPRTTSGVHLLSGRSRLMVDAILGRGGVAAGGDEPAGMVGMAMLVFGVPRYGWRGGAFWRDAWRARDAITRWRDPGPALLQLIGLGEIACRAIRRRCPLLVAATQDIEWNGGPLGGEA